MKYDLIVTGAGPAGYLAAERAGEAGLNTLLVEKKYMGGVCLNEGCIPSKTLLHSAKILDYVKNGAKFGVVSNNPSLDHKKVLKRKNKVVKILTSGIVSRLRKNNVTIAEGSGRIIGKDCNGYNVKVGNEVYTAEKLLIATGASPVIPHIPGLEDGIKQGVVLTNREILEIESVPESLAVIGGGVTGIEMASYFNSAGSKVTVIEMLDRIAPDSDTDISNILLKNYSKKGIEFKLNSKVVKIQDNKVVFESGGEKLDVSAERILVSIGRRPVTDGVGLETIGVEKENGCIKVDEKCRTNIPGVYAAGDVNGQYMLAHAAYREAEVCVNNVLGKKDTMRYNAVPSIIYTNPEVAGVGETEESAKHKGINYETANVSMRYSGRYMAEVERGDGICKVLVDKKHNRIIGVHMIGNYSSEIIYGAGLMIETELKVDDVKELIFPHPTVSEVIREALFSKKWNM